MPVTFRECYGEFVEREQWIEHYWVRGRGVVLSTEGASSCCFSYDRSISSSKGCSL